MRNTLIFAGSSCPALTSQICSNLGMAPAAVDLSQFSNGETSVKILTSIREKDVFVVQSGSSKINDSIMELLILISACKGGSANKITAVLPYFPYSRQSKKKSHRGAITARMLANLLSVAGVQHVVTIDLHASQMQGFFRCPVDNLHAEPLVAKWIRRNVPNWREAVVVSKNAGGTKRVTSLADALKLNFGMVTTDRKRGGGGGGNMSNSMIINGLNNNNNNNTNDDEIGPASAAGSTHSRNRSDDGGGDDSPPPGLLVQRQEPCPPPPPTSHQSPLRQHHSNLALRTHSGSAPGSNRSPLMRATAANPSRSSPIEEEDEEEEQQQQQQQGRGAAAAADEDGEYTDERAREVIHGRLVQGHIVPDDYPSPTQSATSNSTMLDPPDDAETDPLETSRASSFFALPPQHSHPLGGSGGGGGGGTGDAAAAATSDDEDEAGFKTPGLEQQITLVGDVRGRTVFLVDDMIDKAGSWIAAAETVVKRGGAARVYCIATHGLFGSGGGGGGDGGGGDALAELEGCDCVDTVVVTNSFPIPPEKVRTARKLVVLDLSNLLAEAIRRNHYGESISALFQHQSE